MFFLKFAEAAKEAFSHHRATLLEVVASHDLQGGAPLGDGDGVAAVGVEMNPLGEGLGDLVGGDDGGERGAVADAFGHDDDVGLDALGLEAPEGLAGAAEARLDLVGDADTTGGAHVFVNFLQVAVGKDDGPAHALDGFSDETGDLARAGEADQLLDVGRVIFTGVRVVGGPGTAVRVGGAGELDAEGVGDVVLPGVVGGDAHRVGGAAVIRVAQGDDVVVARVGAGEHEGELVGLRAGIDEVADLEVAGHAVGQFLAVLGDAGMEIDGGNVLEPVVLLVDSGEDLGVTVADGNGDDAAKGVEITAAFLVVEVLHRPLHDHKGLAVVVKKRGGEVFFAEFQDFFRARALIGAGLVVIGRKLGSFRRCRPSRSCDGHFAIVCQWRQSCNQPRA